MVSTPSNLPILSNLYLFDKIFPSSHKENQSFRFILSLPQNIVVLLNFLFFYSNLWLDVDTEVFVVFFDWEYLGASQYLYNPRWSQTPFLHEKCLSHTPVSIGLLILLFIFEVKLIILNSNNNKIQLEQKYYISYR